MFYSVRRASRPVLTIGRGLFLGALLKLGQMIGAVASYQALVKNDRQKPLERPCPRDGEILTVEKTLDGVALGWKDV